ncbi:Glutathione S-transferase class-mu 28 kDa isozyme [Holothuria leucospilota]|uniref:glutathione transferase n=1 Tax=Holothuria leucospilota TaxID=206669 RepID=A0A9Q0YHM7_HOLLE|nr:Glutathione S-transferase class-mu 28 kDa isozyme [Holothuria leucospilota]
MSSKYKITYFNARGRAEPARFIFALAGVEFEDFRIELHDWAEWKPSQSHFLTFSFMVLFKVCSWPIISTVVLEIIMHIACNMRVTVFSSL